MQWRSTNIIARMHVSSTGNERIDNSMVATIGRTMQWRYTNIVARTHVSSTGNKRLNYSKVAPIGRVV
jgi:hypothetical protein